MQGLSKRLDGSWTTGAIKHGHIGDILLLTVSALYTITTYKGELPSGYEILKDVSDFIGGSEEIVIAFFVVVFGLVFGSFYNVVGLRVPKKESIVAPPSHCTNCDRRLTALDLIPVLSYVFLGGKCRTCGSKISWIYPLMEFVTGILFVFAYWQFGLSRAW